VKPSPASLPATLGSGSLPDLVTAWRALLDAAGHGEDTLTVLRLGAALEQPDVSPLLRALYPKLKSTRARARALTLALELLPTEARPKSLGEAVLELMVDG